MTKREQIILSVAGVVAVVGLGVLFLGGGPLPQFPDPAAKQAEADAARAQTMLKTLQELNMGNVDGALVAAIDAKWRTGAFYDKPLGGVQAASRLPRYTGFVELGSGRLAIVDGIEYQVGDSLEGGGYKVTAIAPDQIVLEILANGNRVEVPYEGQEALAR
jgi:hypothetical protein